MNTGVKIRNFEEIQKFLKDLPRGTLRTGLDAMSEYFLGNEQHGLRHYPPYKYVARKRAYPEVNGFFSDKQRRYVMAMIRAGKITPGTPKRTGTTAAGWHKNVTNNGYGISIQNSEKSAFYTMSDTGQARQPQKVGWRTMTTVIESNMAGAMRHALAEVKKWIAANKPK